MYGGILTWVGMKEFFGFAIDCADDVGSGVSQLCVCIVCGGGGGRE